MYMISSTLLLLKKKRHQESNRIPDTSTVLVLVYCPGSLKIVKKKIKTKTKNIYHGLLNSASFGQILLGSNSAFLTFREVTNKLFWLYSNINNSRYWQCSFKQFVDIHRFGARIYCKFYHP